MHGCADVAVDGAAASHHDVAKRGADTCHGDANFEFVLFSIKAHGRLGAPTLQVLAHLGVRAAEGTQNSFPAAAACLCGAAAESQTVPLERLNGTASHAVLHSLRPLCKVAAGPHWLMLLQRDMCTCSLLRSSFGPLVLDNGCMHVQQQHTSVQTQAVDTNNAS